MSNAIVEEALAVDLETWTKVVPDPIEPLGYGSDISCTDDLAEDVHEVDPFSPIAIAEAMVRCLDCPRGQLIDDPSYGYDLAEELNRGTTLGELDARANAVRSQITKDDRIATASVTATFSRPDGSALRYAIRVIPEDPRTGGPFSLVLVASSAGVVLDAISRNS